MLQKVLLKPGVNRENTRYTTEGGWYECDKVRFRQGNPETIGGWVPFTLDTFKGVCRLLWNWVTTGGANLIALGTNLKFYVSQGQRYYDITPVRSTTTLGTDPFTGDGTTTVVVAHTSHGAYTNDFVTFSGVSGTYASLLNAEYQITVLDANSYSIVTSSAVAAGTTGGSAVVAALQLNTSTTAAQPITGWGAGGWGLNVWGSSTNASYVPIGLWTAQNYGQDLVFGQRGGGIYYWAANSGVNTRAVALNTLGGTVTFTVSSPTVVTFSKKITAALAVQFSVSAGGTLPTGIVAGTTYYVFNPNGVIANLLDTAGNVVNVTGAGSGTFSVSLLVDVPTVQNVLAVSDTSRFIFALGCNDYGTTEQDKMLVRWSDQDAAHIWSPDATNQAGSVRLSHGSEIVAWVQTRQEQVVFTDSSVYSLQYIGPPIVWSTQLVGDNISIAGPNAVILAAGVVYWMGVDKFYMYDGRTQTLNCDLRRHVFENFNTGQRQQVYAGTNEGFNEVWWFYPSSDADNCDSYIVYNYMERIWYYGTMVRTAWIDSGTLANPIAATYNATAQTGRLLVHETGMNSNEDGTEQPLSAYIASSEFAIGDGNSYGFVWRMLPDLTFEAPPAASTVSPKVTMTLYGLNSSGSGVSDRAGGIVSKMSTDIIADKFTGQINTRVRGRQLVLKVESDQLDTAWQLGAPRIDIRPDGRKS